MSEEFRRWSSPLAGAREEYKIFVGGIPHKYNDRDLKDAFRRHDATRATVMIDRKTGRSRGFGFVYFNDRRACEEAIERMHQTILEGRKVSVTRAVPETQTIPGTPANMLASGRGIRTPRGGRGREPRRDGDRWGSRPHSTSRRDRFSDRYDRGPGRPDSRGRERARSREGRHEHRRSSDGSASLDRGQENSMDRDSGELARRSFGSRGDDGMSGEGRAGGPPAYADATWQVKSNADYNESGFEAYLACPLEDISDYIAQLPAPVASYPTADARSSHRRSSHAGAGTSHGDGGYSRDAQVPDTGVPLPAHDIVTAEGEPDRPHGVVGGMRGASTFPAPPTDGAPFRESKRPRHPASPKGGENRRDGDYDRSGSRRSTGNDSDAGRDRYGSRHRERL